MKKAVFVFLIFTILSLTNSVVLADVFTVKLPPPPDGVDNFVVGYMPNLETYRLGSTDYSGSIYISENGVLIDNNGNPIKFGSRYELVNGNWVFYTDASYWNEWYDNIGFEYEKGKVVVFSSNDFYGTKGQLLASAASDDVLRNGITLVGNQLSSSKILMYMYYSLRKLLPYVIIVIVLIIAFYKGWGWLRGQAQGI